MRFNIHSLPVTKIDIFDTRFQITTRKTIDDLLVSIQKIGLLHLPIVLETDSKMVIVTGFRRIAACRQLGYESILVNIAEPKTPRLRLAQLSIADNASQRKLNLVEMSRAFNLLVQCGVAIDKHLDRYRQVVFSPLPAAA